MGLKEPRRRANAAHVPLSSDSFPWLKKGFPGTWERWFRAYWACFILTGVTALTATQDSFSKVPCCFPEWVPQVGLEGKGGKEWRAAEAGVAFSPSLPLQIFTQQGIQGPGTWSIEVINQITLFFLCSQWREWEGCSKGTNHSSGSLPAGVNAGPAICCHRTRNSPSPLSLHYFFSLPVTKNFGLLLGSSILLCLACGEKGKGSFLVGSWSKWIIARPFF